MALIVSKMITRVQDLIQDTGAQKRPQSLKHYQE